MLAEQHLRHPYWERRRQWRMPALQAGRSHSQELHRHSFCKGICMAIRSLRGDNPPLFSHCTAPHQPKEPLRQQSQKQPLILRGFHIRAYDSELKL